MQKAGAAVYLKAGKAQLKEQVGYYMNNARVIYEGLKDAGYTVSGGVNAPYIWLKTPDGMSSGISLIICWNTQMLWEHRDQVSDRAGKAISGSRLSEIMRIR